MKTPEIVKKNLFTIILTLIGATGGFLYWRYIGCLSGTCPIKSVWYLSTLWGAAFGFLGAGIITDIIRYFRKRNSVTASEKEK